MSMWCYCESLVYAKYTYVCVFVCVCKYVRSYSGVRHLSFVMFGTHPCSATLTATASTAPSANRNATLAHILKSVPSTVYLLNKASMELTREFVPIRRRLEIYRGRPRSPYRSFARALTFSSLHLLRHSVIRSLPGTKKQKFENNFLTVKGQARKLQVKFFDGPSAQSNRRQAERQGVVAPTKIRRPISVLHEAKGRRGAAPRLPRAAAAAPQVQATLRW